MSKPEPTDGLSGDERKLLVDALIALRQVRGQAWNVACDVAEVTEKRQPPLSQFGIDDISRLARRIGGRAALSLVSGQADQK